MNPLFSDSKEFAAPATVSLRLKAFGIARELVGGSDFTLELPAPATVEHLRHLLLDRFPALGHLRSLAIAVNESYADDDLVLSGADEIVLIPPVSGG